MSFILNLESNLSTSTGTPDDFTVNFIETINLDDATNVSGKDTIWEVALHKSNCWYSWYNISAAKGNNIMTYDNGVAADKTVTIPDGQYTLTQINQVLQDFMEAEGDFTVGASGDNEYHIVISPNFSTLRTRIVIDNSYEFDMTIGDLRLLFGFDSQRLIGDDTYESESVANINDSINSLVIKTDVIKASSSWTNNVKSRVLYTFVPNTPPGTNIEISPVTPIYVPVDLVDLQLRRMRIQIVDNLDRVIDFHGEPTSYLLHFRKVKVF
jgi:hypothetical protein